MVRDHIPNLDESLVLAGRVDSKYRPVWEGKPDVERAALAQYFLPHASRKPTFAPTRPRIVKWYCPFAAQQAFPSGHRYCIKLFTCCSHQCEYCYARAYEPDAASAKHEFEQLILKDMQDLERFDVPAAPVHLSNSTDPFQPLEVKTSHARFALEQILRHRHRFTTVTILTKNPLLPVKLGYLDVFKELSVLPRHHPRRAEFEHQRRPASVAEVSLAFWREEARSRYDPGAPAVDGRVEGLQALHVAGITLVLRLDPLFPQSPITDRPPRTFEDFGLPEAQTLNDLEELVGLAKSLSARNVVYSPG